MGRINVIGWCGLTPLTHTGLAVGKLRKNKARYLRRCRNRNKLWQEKEQRAIDEDYSLHHRWEPAR